MRNIPAGMQKQGLCRALLNAAGYSEVLVTHAEHYRDSATPIGDPIPGLPDRNVLWAIVQPSADDPLLQHLPRHMQLPGVPGTVKLSVAPSRIVPVNAHRQRQQETYAVGTTALAMAATDMAAAAAANAARGSTICAPPQQPLPGCTPQYSQRLQTGQDMADSLSSPSSDEGHITPPTVTRQPVQHGAPGAGLKGRRRQQAVAAAERRLMRECLKIELVRRCHELEQQVTTLQNQLQDQGQQLQVWQQQQQNQPQHGLHQAQQQPQQPMQELLQQAALPQQLSHTMQLLPSHQVPQPSAPILDVPAVQLSRQSLSRDQECTPASAAALSSPPSTATTAPGPHGLKQGGGQRRRRRRRQVRASQGTSSENELVEVSAECRPGSRTQQQQHMDGSPGTQAIDSTQASPSSKDETPPPQTSAAVATGIDWEEEAWLLEHGMLDTFSTSTSASGAAKDWSGEDDAAWAMQDLAL